MTELWQFRYSPYNEKARWALALKGVAYAPKPVLPGPHLRTIRKLSGQTATPVLVMDGEVTANSADILARLERAFPDPPLYPADPAEIEDALGWQRRFDEALGPRMRRAVLDVMLGDLGYVAETFAGGRAWPVRAFYRAGLPLAAGLIRKGNGIAGPADAADGHRAIDEAFGLVEDAAGESGYLVGGHFTVADLTAASMLATVVDPDHPDMKRPRPMPSAVHDLIAAHAARPGAEWVREIYRRHRP